MATDIKPRKRKTVLDQAIATIDEKIAGLQLARAELLSQQRQQPERKRKRKDESHGTSGEAGDHDQR